MVEEKQNIIKESKRNKYISYTTNGKFRVQTIVVDHPNVSLSDQFVYKVPRRNSFATLGRDTMQLCGRVMKSFQMQFSLHNKSPKQQILSP